MSSTVTVADIITQIRRRGDYLNDSHDMSDEVLISFVDEAYRFDFSNELIDSGDMYFVTSSLVTGDGTTTDFSLPGDFFKLLGVDTQDDDGDWARVKRFDWKDRERHQRRDGRTVGGVSDSHYLLMGSSIRFEPAPDPGESFRLTYVPAATRLTGSAQTIDGINGGEEIIVLGALRRAKQREFEDTREIRADQAAAMDRFKKMSRNRDRGEPHVLVDRHGGEDWW